MSDTRNLLDYKPLLDWPYGLKILLNQSMDRFGVRFIICDDSGSMLTCDGKRLMLHNSVIRKISCSRFTELCELLKFMADLVRAANYPTEFRMLNNSPPLLIGDKNDATNYNSFMSVLSDSPSGATPLCRHIREVTEKIRAVQDMLKAKGQKACIVICTDGESSDGNIIDAMRPLKELPVWVVVRLCTDEERVVKYWNDIDSQLELDMDVLDDLFGEAEEVYRCNPWLTYGEPLHRLREFGLAVREFDMLDERLLEFEELRRFLSLLFNVDVNTIPEPQLEWDDFVAFIEKHNSLHKKVWSPMDQKEKEWVVISRLNSCYNKGTGYNKNASTQIKAGDNMSIISIISIVVAIISIFLGALYLFFINYGGASSTVWS